MLVTYNHSLDDSVEEVVLLTTFLQGQCLIELN